MGGAIAVYVTSGSLDALVSFLGISAILAAGAVLVTVIRQERQNQRNNSKLKLLTTKVDSVRQEGLNRMDVDSPSVSAQEFAAGLASLRSAVLGISTVTDHLNEILVRSERLVGKQAANVTSFSFESDELSDKQIEGTSTQSPVSLEPASVSPKIVFESEVVPESESEASREVHLLLNDLFPETSSFPLSSEPITIEVPLILAGRVEVKGALATLTDKAEARMAVAYAECFDASGRQIDFKVLPAYSEKFGYFTYLESNSANTNFAVNIDVPRAASSMKLHFVKWGGYSEISNKFEIKIIEENPKWKSVRRPKDIRVAAILDEFSYNSFKYECNLLSLDPGRWLEQLDGFQPDLFLCESAWSGHDSDLRPWKGRIYTSTNFKSENRGALLEILDYCSKMGIPTVFWNKEDPSHYEDEVHNFIDTAIKFDHIFTTDIDCVERYRHDYGHESVDVLPFAVQPRMFNPIKTSDRTDVVTFAGGWYSNHVRRSEGMSNIFRTILDSGRGLKIYDRFWGSGDDSHEFPKEFQQYLNPPVPNDVVSGVYKESEVSLTINTETTSPTMFARRIFELMACDTFVISNYSAGVEQFFGENVLFLDKNPSGLRELTPEKALEIRRENLQNVLTNHTYEKRFEKILSISQIEFNSDELGSAVVVLVSETDSLEKVWRKLQTTEAGSHSVKTIVLSGTMSPLEYAQALTDFNSGGVRLIYLPMLSHSDHSADQLLGSLPDAVILHSSDYLNGALDGFSLNEMRIHSTYIDLPIVRQDENESNSDKYAVVDMVGMPGFVTKLRSLEYLRSLDSSSPSKTYVV